MPEYPHYESTSIVRPRCFYSQFSDLSTLSVHRGGSTVDRTGSIDCRVMNESGEPNKASAEEKFLRHSLAVSFDNTVESNEQSKKGVRKLLRQVSLDLLAAEWLNLEPRTIESRAYLIGSVLPQVVFGLEYILREAVAKHLVGPDCSAEALANEGFSANFNPINRLAEFLMRNNHKYSNFPETSPYVRGLRNVVAKQQHEMFMRSDNQLARLKAAVTKGQEERARRHADHETEQARRRGCVEQLFGNFLSENRTNVDSIVVHDAVRTFLELAIKLPDTLKSCLVPLFEIKLIEDPPSTYGKDEFIMYLMLYAEPLTSEFFDQLITHLRLCATEYLEALQREHRKHVLTQFFVSCNTDEFGILERARIINLCDTYFESAPNDLQSLLRDPRDWPVREYHLRTCMSPLGASEADEGNEGTDITQQSAEGNNSAAVLSPILHGDYPMNEGEDVGEERADISNEEVEVVDDADAISVKVEEVVTETNINNENTTSTGDESSVTEKVDEEVQDNVKDSNNDKEGAVSPVAELDAPDEATDREELDIVEQNSTELKSPTDEHGDEDAQLVEQSVKFVAKKHIDEKTLLMSLSARSERTSRLTSTTSSQRQQNFGYIPEKLSLFQFLQLTDAFIVQTASLEVVKNFIAFLELHYQEDQVWRALQTQEIHMATFKETCLEILDELFSTLDTDLSGYLDLAIVEQEIGRYRKGTYMAALKNAKQQLVQQTRSNYSRVSQPQMHKADEGIRQDALSARDLIATEKIVNEQEDDIVPPLRSQRLKKSDFQLLVCETLWPGLRTSKKTTDSMQLETLEDLVDFMQKRHKLQFEEQMKQNTRQHWLRFIDQVARESMVSMEKVYRAVFQALVKDAVKHGGGKRVSAHVSILRTRPSEAIDLDETVLVCCAAIPELEATTMVGKQLSRQQPNSSFKVLETGHMLHVPRVFTQPHPCIHFWRGQSLSPEKMHAIGTSTSLDPTDSTTMSTGTGSQMSRENTFLSLDEGASNNRASCVLIPVPTPSDQLIGVLGVDTLGGASQSKGFAPHELDFYQGVASRLGSAYVQIGLRRSLTQLVTAAFLWLAQHLDGSIEKLTFYHCLDRKTEKTMPEKVKAIDPEWSRPRSCVLMQLVSKDRNESTVVHREPEQLKSSQKTSRAINLLQVVNTSETCEWNHLGKFHVSYPLRDGEQVAMGVIDLCLGHTAGGQTSLSVDEQQSVINMIGILSTVYAELSQQVEQPPFDRLVQEEDNVDDADASSQDLCPSVLETFRPGRIFEMLTRAELDVLISKLNKQIYSELQSYTDPPAIVPAIVSAIVYLLDSSNEPIAREWDLCRPLVNRIIERQLPRFDPFKATGRRTCLIELQRFMSALRAALFLDNDYVRLNLLIKHMEDFTDNREALDITLKFLAAFLNLLQAMILASKSTRTGSNPQSQSCQRWRDDNHCQILSRTEWITSSRKEAHRISKELLKMDVDDIAKVFENFMRTFGSIIQSTFQGHPITVESMPNWLSGSICNASVETELVEAAQLVGSWVRAKKKYGYYGLKQQCMIKFEQISITPNSL